MVTLFALTLVLSADPVRYELQGSELMVPSPIVFDTGKASLKDESNAALEHVKGYLEAKPYITMMRVEVHTDSRGDDQANQKLSEARAVAVVDALVKKGVACNRLLAVGFGETKPIAPNDTPEGAAANRRTAFVNAELKGKAMGGMPVDGGGVAVKSSCQK